MHRKQQSVTMAHKRGSGCLYKSGLTKSVQFIRKKGSTAEEWRFAVKNKIFLPDE